MALQVKIRKKLGAFTLDVAFETGEQTMGIYGPSGCGKSMTLRCIAGIEKPDAGRIVLDGQVLYDSERKINIPSRKRKIGYMFQNYALFPTMTVEQNLRIAGAEDPEEAAARFHLDGLLKLYPGQLSGGQAQRVALARMMVNKPQMILLDEPFSALDTELKEQLYAEMKEQLREYGGNVILVTHDRYELEAFCPQVTYLRDGHVVDSHIPV